ncbi:MAG: zf-HC2 domain-containing protein [Candidatus Aquicultor sp.]
MDCKQARFLLSYYHDKKLNKQQSKEVTEHLKACPACAQAYATLQELPELIRSIPVGRLPRRLRRRIRIRSVAALKGREDLIAAEIEPDAELRRFSAVIRYAAIAVIVMAIAAVPLSLTHGPGFSSIQGILSPQDTTVSSVNDLDSGAGTQKDGSLKPKPLDSLDQPELSLSTTQYDATTAEKAATRISIVKFAHQYRVIEARAYQQKLVSSMADRVNEAGKQPGSFTASVKLALRLLGKPSLPSYAEEVLKDDKKLWVIVLNWDNGTQDAPLSQVTVFTIDPSTPKIIDCWPRAPQNAEMGSPPVNPHGSLYCVTCHSNFNNDSPSFQPSQWKAKARESCVNCHDHKAQADVYAQSVHGRAAASADKGKSDTFAPDCVDCHGGHITSASNDTARMRVAMRLQVQETCGSCHKDYWEPYNDYYHGKAFIFNTANVPACWDCHGYHDIQRSSNPVSHVARANLPMTCAKCHSTTDLTFIQYGRPVHSDRGESVTDMFWRYLNSRLYDLQGKRRP